MRLEDITVEARTRNLVRVGLIRPEDLRIELTVHHNAPGEWKLQLGSDHPLAEVLREPGAGLIVTGPDGPILTGPMVRHEAAATPEDPGGSVTVEGVSDCIILRDAIAYPDPRNPDIGRQAVAHDRRQGSAEDVMHAFVNANIGPEAPAARRCRHLARGTSRSRGPEVIKTTRFATLGNLMTELAALGHFGFRVVQQGSQLAMEVHEIADRTRTIRLDVLAGTLAGQRVAVGAPGLTRAIVAGQGELTARQLLQAETPESVAAEEAWGRRIERFIDRRQTEDWDELRQAGAEALEEEGRTSIDVQAVPMEDSSMRFGRDWSLGDSVTVVVDEQELTSLVTGMILRADADGFRVGALLGDPSGWSPAAALARRVAATQTRLSHLERAADGGGASQVMSLMGAW